MFLNVDSINKFTDPPIHRSTILTFIKKLFLYQHWHFLFLSILLAGLYFYVNTDPLFLKGKFLEIATSKWFLLAILIPILHQIYVVVCWRLELFYKSISKKFGALGFKLFKVGFALLFISRLLTIILLALLKCQYPTSKC